MSKKRLLSTILAVTVLVTFTLSLNACKKKTNEDEVPTEVTVLRGEGHYAYCDHCDGILWDRNWYTTNGPHWDPDDWNVFHVHEYQEGEPCALRHCRYDRRHHKHEVYYLVDPVTGQDHYQDDWIHIGGGGDGGN